MPIDDRSFENYQRILDNTHGAQITIMNFVLAFQAAGYAGIYQIISESNVELDKVKMLRALAVVMLIITSILLVVWKREDRLADLCLRRLEDQKVEFPRSDDCWKGKTGLMWRLVHWTSIIVWLDVWIFTDPMLKFFISEK